MKARELKKELNNTGYAIHETNEYICVGSPYCSDLISVRKDNLKMRYALDTFNEGKRRLTGKGELLFIWEKLESLIVSGKIQYFIEGSDTIENPLPVFSYDDECRIISSVTDEYGWPNTDINGRMMYENTWFPTEKEAIQKAIDTCDSIIKWKTEAVEERRTYITEAENKISEYQQAKSRLKQCLNTTTE